MVERGAELFPWSLHHRVRPGYFAIAYLTANEDSAEMIENALKTDPLAADLNYGLAVQDYLLGRHSRANELFDRVSKLAPNSETGKRIKHALQEKEK